MKIKRIQDIDFKNKRVFLRADLNVPIKDKQILQDYRLEKILPTIDYILKKEGKIILATHIGRPKATEHSNYFDENLSTKILEPWFLNKGYKIRYKIDLNKAAIFSHENFKEILLLENLRFYNGEQGAEKERNVFCELLKNLADVYINDAFALIHRDDTSVTLLPQKFIEKAFGFLVENEIKELDKIKNNPKQPFIIVIGGNKIETKMPLLESFFKKNQKNKPYAILIGGAIANQITSNFTNLAKKENIKILLPLDQFSSKSKKIFINKNITSTDFITDIGPKTVKLFCEEIEKAKTIFVNGSMGIYQEKENQEGTKKILECIVNSNSYKVAGGGDCVAAIYMFNLEQKFNFLSTGGGATLAYLASNNPQKDLPGLFCILNI